MLLSIRKPRKITEIPLVRIRPCRTQARKIYDLEELKELAVSIKNNGVIQPLVVRKISSEEYELIAGERRLRALAMCGKNKAPCIIITCTDKEAGVYSLAENMQRCNLNVFEEAQGINSLMSTCQLTQTEAANYLGKKQRSLDGMLNILLLSKEERDLIIGSRLTEAHARALLKIKDKTERRIVLSEIIERHMNVSQTEYYISTYLSKTSYEKRQHQRRKAIIKDIRLFENTINKAVNTMQLCGIDAVSAHTENDNFIEYTVRISRHAIPHEAET